MWAAMKSGIRDSVRNAEKKAKDFAGEEKLYKDLCPRIRRSGDRISYTLYRKDSYIPAAVKEVKGTVEHPEYILTSDVNRAYFGCTNIEECFRDRSKAETVHSMTITLKKEKI